MSYQSELAAKSLSIHPAAKEAIASDTFSLSSQLIYLLHDQVLAFRSVSILITLALLSLALKWSLLQRLSLIVFSCSFFPLGVHGGEVSSRCTSPLRAGFSHTQRVALWPTTAAAAAAATSTQLFFSLACTLTPVSIFFPYIVVVFVVAKQSVIVDPPECVAVWRTACCRKKAVALAHHATNRFLEIDFLKKEQLSHWCERVAGYFRNADDAWQLRLRTEFLIGKCFPQSYERKQGKYFTFRHTRLWEFVPCK